jgi:hypothetical protein
VSRPRSCCIIRQWTLGADSPLTARLKAGPYVTPVIRCLTNLSYAIKTKFLMGKHRYVFLTDFIVVPDRSSAGLAICLKKFAIPAAERGDVSPAGVAALFFVPVI